ncbi:MAG: hypothetical protein LBP92_14590 [Deltaproteobacteria bacterium]|nr:hypothetical protein [Deltaproteobacteria bacterium]
MFAGLKAVFKPAKVVNVYMVATTDPQMAPEAAVVYSGYLMVMTALGDGSHVFARPDESRMPKWLKGF